MDIIEKIRTRFAEEGTTVRLIYINFLVYVIILFSSVLCKTLGTPDILRWLMMPTTFEPFIYRPWTLLTYMFVHADFIHILFNMMCLYWFGRLMSSFVGDHVILRTYIVGGLVGGFLSLLCNEFIFNSYGSLLGASAAVLAILTAVATLYPNYYVEVVFIGQVKLKYYALFFVILYMIFILGGESNIGGNIAHLGGMAAGFAMALTWKKNGFPQQRSTTGIFAKKKTKMRVVYSKHMDDMNYNEQKRKHSQEVDRILDKIKETGYESLTSIERQTLFDESKR
ncbi:MAG: rhomboid family intramembrane serine protease [Bacteroidales bacterium]|nr:rhomboid family intramembrane serine protease [Bacteroidales bacterium]